MTRSMPAFSPIDFNPYAEEDEEDRLAELLRAAEAQQAIEPAQELGVFDEPAPPAAMARRAPIQLDEQVIDVPREMAPEPDSTWASDEMAALEGQPAPQTDYQTAASRMTAPDTDGGKRSDLYGNEDEDIFEPQQRIKQATELYKQLPQDAPSAPNNRWEDEFLKSHKYATDDDIQGSFFAQTLFGDKGDNFKMRDSMMRQRQQYDQGLSKAHEQDLIDAKEGGGRGERISLGLAQAIASTGRVSPEAAVQLRTNDSVVKAYTSGMFAQGLTEREQDRKINAHRESEMGKNARTEMNIGGRKDIADDRNATELQKQAMRDAKKGGGKGGDGSRISPEAFAAHLAEHSNLDMDIVSRHLAGDAEATAQIPPDKLAKLERERVIFGALIPKKQQDVLASGTKREGGSVDQTQTFVDKIRNDKKYAVDSIGDMQQTAIVLGDANSAWRGMHPDSKKAFVQLAATGDASKVVQSKIYAQHPGDQARAGAVIRVLNELTADRSGKAVTDSEFGRLSAEMGVTNKGWSPFTTTEGIERHLSQAKRLLLARKKLYDETINGGVK